MLKKRNKSADIILHLVKYIGVGVVTYPLGNFLLFVGITLWGLEPIWANVLQGIVLMPVGFWLNRRITYPERAVDERVSFIRYCLAGVPIMAATIYTNLVVHHHGVSYQHANWAIVPIYGVINFAMTYVWIFTTNRRKNRQTKA